MQVLRCPLCVPCSFCLLEFSLLLLAAAAAAAAAPAALSAKYPHPHYKDHLYINIDYKRYLFFGSEWCVRRERFQPLTRQLKLPSFASTDATLLGFSVENSALNP